MVKDENYISIQGWMVNKLKLKGNELLIFACIYGFSQDGESWLEGSANYLGSWAGISRTSVFTILKKLLAKGFIEKKDIFVNRVKLCNYKTSEKVFNLIRYKETCGGDSKKLDRGYQETVRGGYKKTVPHIIDNHNIEDNINIFSGGSAEPKKQNRFIPPTEEEVREYCKQRGNWIDPIAFIAHYESKGWMIGKNKMKDWRAAVITWERNRPDVKQKKQAEIEKRQEKQRLVKLQEKWAREEEEQRLKAEADRREAEERKRDADEFDRQLYGATITELSERLRQRQG